MNGASAVLPATARRIPIVNKTMTIGASQYFLLCLIYCQISLMTLVLDICVTSSENPWVRIASSVLLAIGLISFQVRLIANSTLEAMRTRGIAFHHFRALRVTSLTPKAVIRSVYASIERG
jgi:hypothetical protein